MSDKAYNIFVHEQREIMKNKNMTVSEFIKLCRQNWDKLGEDERKRYSQKSEKKFDYTTKE